MKYFFILTATLLFFTGCSKDEERKITTIQLDKITLAVKAQDTYQFQVIHTPADLPAPVYQWTSSNTSVASVSSAGLLTALSEGQATISVTLPSDPVSSMLVISQCAVTVSKQDATGITLNETTLTLEKGTQETLTYTLVPESSAISTALWSSSDATIATVDQTGKVVAIAEGTAVIRIQDQARPTVFATCNVTVSKVNATSVTLNKQTLTLVLGAKETLIYTTVPEGSVIINAYWQSSNEAVASVSEDGEITALELGSAVVKVSSPDKIEPQVMAECQVSVVRPTVTSIIFNKTTLTLEKGSYETLSFTSLPQHSLVANPVWTSSNTNIATVNDQGEVLAVAVGSADITISDAALPNIKAVCKVTVNPATITAIHMGQASKDIYMGEEVTLAYSTTPEGSVLPNRQWTSNHPEIVSVTQDGKIKGLAIGEAIVTLSSSSRPELTAQCTVTVNPLTVTSLVLNKTAISLTAGTTEILTHTITPTNATDKEVVWSSSNGAIATVSAGGLVTAIGVGTCDITVKLKNGTKSTSCQVVVYKLATGIVLSHATLSMTYAQKQQLSVTHEPAEADPLTYRWSTNDSWVATVSSLGLVETKHVGEATITVESLDGRLKKECKITVNPTKTGWKEPALDFGASKDAIKTKEALVPRVVDTKLNNLADQYGVNIYKGENNNIEYCMYAFTEYKMSSGILIFKTPNIAAEAEAFYAERYEQIYPQNAQAGIKYYMTKTGTVIELGVQPTSKYIPVALSLVKLLTGVDIKDSYYTAAYY